MSTIDYPTHSASIASIRTRDRDVRIREMKTRSSGSSKKVKKDFRDVGIRRTKVVKQKEKMDAMASTIEKKGWDTPIMKMYHNLNWSNQDAVNDVFERMERYFVSKSCTSGYQTDPTVLAKALQWFVFRLEDRGYSFESDKAGILQAQLDSVSKSDTVKLMLMFDQWWSFVED